MPSSRAFSVVAAGLIGLFAATTVAADTGGPGGTDTLLWNNPNGGAWTDAANWTPNNVPDTDNEVAVMKQLPGGGYTVTLGSNMLCGGLRVDSLITFIFSGQLIEVDGVPINRGTIRLTGGAIMHVNRPLLINRRGTIIAGAASDTMGGSVLVAMPITNWGTVGTIDNTQGQLVSDGGPLTIRCGMLLNGEFQRISGNQAVRIQLANMQNATNTAGTEMIVETLLDMTVNGSHLTNHGTIRVPGQINIGGTVGNSGVFSGTGEIVLEEGILDTPAGAAVVNESGHTIRGCGTIRANLINYGTVESDCDFSVLQLKALVENHGDIRDRRGFLWIYGSAANVTNAGTIAAIGGTIWIDQGAAIDNRQGVIGAYGRNIEIGRGTTASVWGGVLEGTGTGTLHNQGTVTLQDVTLSPGATLRTWPGSTTIATGASLTNQGSMRVQGMLTLGASTEYVQNSSAGATSLEGGTISATRELQIQSGELRGYGTIAAPLLNGGTVSPDPLLGALRVQGNYHQLAAGRLNVGLAGSGPGQVSLLDVTGSAQLDGTIEAGVVGGFEPLPGRQYEVLSYGSFSGAFSSVIVDLAGSLDVSPVYDADGLDLLVSGVTGVESPTVPRALAFYGRGASPAEFVIELPHDATLTVRAYDARGREVSRLADGPRPAGVHRLALSGARDLPSGVYFARATIASGGRVETRTARVVSLR